jgi:protein TonB
MSETTAPGQILILKNLRMNREAACRVVNYKARENVKGYVEVEFLEPAPGFWGIEFPAPRADRSTSAAEQPNPTAPRLSVPPATPQPPKSAGKPQSSSVPLLPDLLSPESQTGLVSARESSPSSLFGFEPPKAPTATPKPEAAPPSATEKETRPAVQQHPRPEDTASLTDLLDSLTPLGEQVLLGKGLGQGTANSSLRKTPVPGASSPFPDSPTSDKSVERKPQDFSLQVSAELVRAESQARTAPHPSPEFERPSPSAEPIFSSLPRKHSTAVLGGPIFSAGEPEPTSARSSGRKTLPIAVAMALLVLGAGGFGYYRLHSRLRAPAASIAAATATPAALPATSSHDVTAPVDTTSTTASQPEPGATDLAPALAPVPASAATPAAGTASTPAHGATVRVPPAPSATQANSAPTPAPAPAAHQPAPRNQPANLKMNSPTVTSTSRASTEEAPNLSGAVPGASSNGQSNGVGGIVQSDSQAVAPPAPKSEFRQPQLISSVPPVYPNLARSQNIRGDVVVDLLVDETGNVVQAQVVSGPVLLRGAAVDALRKSKYRPATLDGKATSAHVVVTIHFNE